MVKDSKAGSLFRVIQGLKERPCMDCKGSFPPECMDFDHRPGYKKIAAIGTMVASRKYRLDAILDEIDKCDLVCANCHRTRTKNRGQGKRSLASKHFWDKIHSA